MFEIVEAPIDPQAVEAAVRAPACGGIVSFSGVVRESADDGRAVSGLRYEAHAAMARASFAEIADEIRRTMPEVRLAIVHRIGPMPLRQRVSRSTNSKNGRRSGKRSVIAMERAFGSRIAAAR